MSQAIAFPFSAHVRKVTLDCGDMFAQKLMDEGVITLELNPNSCCGVNAMLPDVTVCPLCVQNSADFWCWCRCAVLRGMLVRTLASDTTRLVHLQMNSVVKVFPPVVKRAEKANKGDNFILPKFLTVYQTGCYYILAARQEKLFCKACLF